MFKKLPLTLVFALFAFASYAQTIVSTAPENKNVILEEFTGIHCVYCPSGHAIAQAIQDANPARVSLINIHQGSFANPSGNEPDFRTRYGNAIAGQTGLNGYPSGTVNRHIFSGNKTILDRGQWTARANQIMAEPSYVNLAATATVTAHTNVMEILVEGYYTGNSPESTNFLNVVLLQNNTRGPQTGGGQGNNYNHMHRLVDMITGQWGEEITQTTSGTFVSRNYTYPIPCDSNGVPIEIGELEIVVFMAETTQEIVSGNRVTPTVNVQYANDANIRCVDKIESDCEGTEITFSPKVNIQNSGSSPITSLNIDYSVNGASNSYTWSGNLASLKSETLVLPAVTLTLLASNTLEISIPNDDYNANNSQVVSFGSPSTTGTVDLTITTDNKGNQCRWNIKNNNGSIVASGGPYANNQTFTERINLDEDCFKFTLFDTGSDGGNIVTLKDSNNVEIFHTDGDYTNFIAAKFLSNGVLGVNQASLEDVNIYPNPAQNVLNIANAENASIQIYDILGKTILSKQNIAINEVLDVANLQSGAYFIKISKDGSVSTKKFMISN